MTFGEKSYGANLIASKTIGAFSGDINLGYTTQADTNDADLTYGLDVVYSIGKFDIGAEIYGTQEMANWQFGLRFVITDWLILFPALRAAPERHFRISVGSFSNHQLPSNFEDRSSRNSVGRANLADRCAVTVRYPTQCFTSLHDVADRFACFGKIGEIIAREHERVGPKGKIFEIDDVIRIERLPAKTYLKMQMASG
jgi:hypothetical protein